MEKGERERREFFAFERLNLVGESAFWVIAYLSKRILSKYWVFFIIILKPPFYIKNIIRSRYCLAERQIELFSRKCDVSQLIVQSESQNVVFLSLQQRFKPEFATAEGMWRIFCDKVSCKNGTYIENKYYFFRVDKC